MIDEVRISYIAATSLSVEKNGIVKTFPLEEGQLPNDFKVGDLVELSLEGDPMAVVWGDENSQGYHSLKHVSSGKDFKIWHKDISRLNKKTTRVK